MLYDNYYNVTFWAREYMFQINYNLAGTQSIMAYFFSSYSFTKYTTSVNTLVSYGKYRKLFIKCGCLNLVLFIRYKHY